MKVSLIPQLVLLCSGLALSNLASSSPSSTPLPQSTTGTVLTARRPTNVIFHPSTGTCMLRTNQNKALRLGPCNESDAWEYTPQKFLTVKGTYFCLQAVGSNKPAKLSIICTESDSQWDMNSSSNSDAKTHVSTNLEKGGSLCLAVGPEDILFTSPCLSSDVQQFEFTTKDKVQALG
ncbi:hypothetical protein LUZ62_022625 [Rhynchospora pubera]|uniref:Ricin B lectin domain-containing protein n=1 Tax=Rhynchospora pubera TaxID=906938 RepID=A0AAV8GYC4_9POAL|nr:hypothetical protein LUZ62_022625 [Rhynchospora pubera]